MPTAKRASFIMMNMYSRPRLALADQRTDGAALVTKGQHRRRASMDAQLVFDGHAVHVVALARRTVSIEQELRHNEQGDALHPLRCVRQTSQHQVDDVVGHVVLTVGDEDLLTENLVGAIALRHCTSTHRRQVGAGLRLGEVHGAGPFAADHLR